MFKILETRENTEDKKLPAEHVREYQKDLEWSIATNYFIFYCKFNFNIRTHSRFNVSNVQIYHFGQCLNFM